MKKICFVVSSPFVANAFLPYHIVTLKKEFDVYVVANYLEGLAELSLPQLEENHAQHIRIERSIHPINDIKALISLKNYFDQNKFDVVHSITPKAGLLTMMAAKLSGIKHRVHIFTGQVWYTKKGFMKILLMLIDKIIVKLATHILVDGESQRKFLIDSNIIKSSNSQVLGKGSICGVDTSRFVPDAVKRSSLRKELSFSDDDVVFCFLGRINKDKGILDLAKAFNVISHKHTNAKFLIVGSDEGDFIMQVKAIVDSDNALVVYGPTTKPEYILQVADVFCLPSYREGFGTSVIEASLLGLPAICSDTYGLMDTIIDNETGLRHKTGDVDSIIDKMEKLIKFPDLRQYLGNNGRKYIIDNFSAHDVSGYWLNFYRKNFMN